MPIMHLNVAVPILALVLFVPNVIGSRHLGVKLAEDTAVTIPASGVVADRAMDETVDLHHPNVRGKRKKKKERTADAPWKVVDMECGVTVKVTSSDIKDEFCPPECPYYAQDRTDDRHCTFACVKKEECASRNPNKPIGDFKLGTCRAPMVTHCRDYVLDGTDTCKTCQSLYALDENGQCHYKYFWLLYLLLFIFVTIVAFIVVWVTDLIIRPETNRKGLDQGVRFRSNQKLRQPKTEGGHRTVWPLSTNLCKENVAGPGMMLHMNFQVCVIVWALFVAIVWTMFALIIDNDLFILGTRKFGTPRDNCILVAWGYETQQRLMWTKCLFVIIIYVSSFALAIFYGVRQLRLFQEFDYEHNTFKDFAALCVGLPSLPGSEKVEDELKKAISDATQENVVGVSICWDFKENEETVQKAVDDATDKLAKRYEEKKANTAENDEPAGEMNPLRSTLFEMECAIFGEDPEEEEGEDDPDKRIKDLLENSTSTKYAFVVFESEEARNNAMERVADGFTYKDSTVKLEYKDVEPDTVLWQNFGPSTLATKIFRFAVGFGCIFLALLFWTTVFYAPYAWSVMNFNYDNGQEPGFIYGISFSMVVVVGNAIMYETCNRVSVYIGFKNNDDRESCYLILYTIACTFNIMADMITTYFIALYVMQGLDFRTYDGTRLAKIDKFHEQFDTYAMQRSLAQNTYSYAFPSTFLIPFLIEPIATVLLPLKIGVWLVRSHPEMLGRAAEGWLQAAPMDLGRYGDILLDIVLGILLFYFPGGYTWSLFFAMGFCHMYIYAFDHWKILCGIPACCYASMSIDWWAQAMFAPCIGLMLSCLVFKGNCQDYGYCIGGSQLIEVCVAVWFLHCVVHILLLKYLVPLFGLKEPEEGMGGTYRAHAEANPANWFVTNPMHCLRSRYIYKHKTPVTFFECGKEHLMEVNEEYCCLFQDIEPFGDEEARDAEMMAGAKKFGRAFTSVIHGGHSSDASTPRGAQQETAK